MRSNGCVGDHLGDLAAPETSDHAHSGSFQSPEWRALGRRGRRVRAAANVRSRSDRRATTISEWRQELGAVAVALALLMGMVGSNELVSGVLAADGCPEPNDTPERACELRVDRTIEDVLANAEDADRFRLDVKDGQSVLVT